MIAEQEERLVALETRLAHQEQMIEELHDLVFQQGQALDGMKRDLEQVADRLHQALRRDDLG
ncbi:MAG: SlyX family protein [Kiloniellales bacterium]|nr:SlyX family protein [Kiloniellales bacterium]